jgi:hypothetical protein
MKHFNAFTVFMLVGTVLAGPSVGASSGTAAGTGARPEEHYLKYDGRVWHDVIKGPAGVRVLGTVAAPAVPKQPAAQTGTGAGLFDTAVAYPTGSWPEAVAIGDVNGDGRPDVLMVTSFYFDAANDYTLHVFLQNADGSLAPDVKYPVGTNLQSVAIGDVNGDGRNDVVVAGGTSLTVFLQNESGTLVRSRDFGTNDGKCVRIADLNNDGKLDVVSLGWGTNTVSVFLQQPDGTLAFPVTYAAPHAGYDDLEVSDVNADGLTDVVVMSGQAYAVPQVSVLYQQADGTLGGLTSRFVVQNNNAGGIGVGDVNGDGRNDIVASYGGNRPDSHVGLVLQDATGHLTDGGNLTSYDIPEPVEVADVDQDGKADVIVVHGGWEAMGVYLQGNGGTLVPEYLYPVPYASHYNTHGLAVGDINGDGLPDVVIADYNHGLVVLRHLPAVPAPQLSVVPPAAPLVEGVPAQFQWTATMQNLLFDVSVSTDGGLNYAPVPGCTGLGGMERTCTWTSPGPPTDHGLVKVVARDGTTVRASGTAEFVIGRAQLTLTAPTTAVVWAPGTTAQVTWTSNGVASNAVAVELSRDGGKTWSVLAAQAPNTGSYPWSVVGPNTALARIRITWVGLPAVQDASRVNFIIDHPPTADAGPDVVVELGRGTILDGTRSKDADGDPITYRWRDALGNTLGTAPRVIVKPTTLGPHPFTLAVQDRFGVITEDTVSVVAQDTKPPLVIVTAPARNSQLRGGLSVPVRWTASDGSGLAAFNVSVAYNGSTTFADVPGCEALLGSNRSCAWTPPATGATRATVCVRGRDGAGNFGTGCLPYIILPEFVRVTAPNTAVTWRIGATVRIAWLHNLGAGTSVKVEISRDDGATWETVADSVANAAFSGAVLWPVSGPPTAQGRVRVTSSADATISDVSDVGFTIK